RGVSGELDVVCREPARENRARAQSEMDCDRLAGGVKHRQDPGAAAGARLHQAFDHLHDRSVGEPVKPSGAAVLSRLPSHQQPQTFGVPRVEVEGDRAKVTLEYALVATNLFIQARTYGDVVLESTGHVDYRRRVVRHVI